MKQLELRDLHKSFGDASIIKGVNLDVEQGEFVVFVGPSGCGKSTLLRMIAGLEDVTRGNIIIGGQEVEDLPPVKRGIAMVFQSYALYPHMTVYENIAFPLRVEMLPEAEVKARVDGAAKILKLEERLQHKPGVLSGGQRQRVAIGRAIVRQPKIFLFDEPLSNLDAALRSDMRVELLRLHKSLGTTMVYVTHDQVEAMTMADKIVVLNGGVIEQVGSPLELYNTPQNMFVAGFIGSPKMNFIEVTCSATTATTITVESDDLGSLRLPIKGQVGRKGERLVLGIRPEHVKLGSEGASFVLRPALLERLGLHTIAYCTMKNDKTFTALLDGVPDIAVDNPLKLNVLPESIHVFTPDGEALARS